MNNKTIETIYPLSPLQQGILYHSLSAPNTGVYIIQSCYRFVRQSLNLVAFQKAWQEIVNRHAVLRSSFHWDRYKEPFQVVHKQVTIPWQEYDWRNLSALSQEQRLEKFIEDDLHSGFDLAKAPLLRLTLIELDDVTCQLIWTKHHLISDGWSNALLLKELLDIYSALCNNQQLPGTRHRPYGDYIAWLRQQDLSMAQTFWQEFLKGFTAPTPIRLPHPVTQKSYGEQTIALSPESTADLQAFAQQHQLTINTLVQGAWAILLSRYSGEDDIVFGVTSAGRPPSLVGSDSMVGLFINTLPLRVQVTPSAMLLPWLQELQMQQVQAKQYEYSPLSEVHGWSEVPRSMPLFESILVFENYPKDAGLKVWGHNLSIREVRSRERPHYPITVTANLASTLSLSVLYSGERCDAQSAARLLSQLKTLLLSMVSDPAQRLCSLPLMTENEQKQQLLCSQIAHYPQTQSLIERFEDQVKRTPNSIAIVFEQTQLTYQELNQQANQLAHYLTQKGIKKGDLVGLCLERSEKLMIGLLAILKAGGAYVPLDPNYPTERLEFICYDAQLSVVVTQKTLGEKLPSLNIQLVCLDTDAQAISQAPVDNPPSSNTSTDLAYVIYTSGSTGKPKGVLIPHGNVLRLFAATQEQFLFSEEDVWTLFHSYAFDFSVWEIWGALLYGGKLVVVPYCVSRNTEAFYELLHQQQVTVLNQTPSAFTQLIAVEEGATEAKSLALRLVIFGGEALSLASLRPWFARHGDQFPQLVNMYGITETTVHVTYRPLKQADLETTTASLIGRPISDLSIYLLDRFGQPVPVGVPGEMYIGGAGLAWGYLNRPELTAEKFVPHPFCEQAGERLYRSGDLARYLPNGELEYLGRIDHQVKIRGFRIELGEIEAILAQYPGIRESVVMLREREEGSKESQLVAYLVTHSGLVPSLSDLRDFLLKRLPDYMVPSAFVLLDRLPLTVNGKVNRQALPALNSAANVLAPDSEYGRPRTPLEEQIAEIWSQVLGRQQVGIYDNFFELGGHSLLATQIVSRLRTVLKLELPLSSLFETLTISGLAEFIERLRSTAQQLQTPALTLTDDREEIEL